MAAARFSTGCHPGRCVAVMALLPSTMRTHATHPIRPLLNSVRARGRHTMAPLAQRNRTLETLQPWPRRLVRCRRVSFAGTFSLFLWRLLPFVQSHTVLAPTDRPHMPHLQNGRSRQRTRREQSQTNANGIGTFFAGAGRRSGFWMRRRSPKSGLRTYAFKNEVLGQSCCVLARFARGDVDHRQKTTASRGDRINQLL